MMKLHEYLEKFNQNVSVGLLVRITLIFVIVLLGIYTWPFWKSLIDTAWAVVSPFAVGFLIAYILSDPVNFLESKGIRRSVSIPLIYVLVFAFIIWLLWSIVPMVFVRVGDLLNSVTAALNWVYSAIMSGSEEVPVWLSTMILAARDSINDIRRLMPDLTTTVPNVVGAAMNMLMFTVFTTVISIFMCLGWHQIKYYIKRLVGNISAIFSSCLTVIDYEVGSYLHSLLILMVIRFFEYSLVYLIVGHQDWMILALLTSLALLVPYLGPTVVNCLGILTALTLDPVRIFILVAFIVVLSFVDEYVIAPLVHSHNTGVTPLWSLFSIFAGGTLFGAVGIIAAIPAFLSIRSIYDIFIRKGGQA
ncbi:MAG: AI-2E family transporter [Bulleidia sp.]